MNDRLSQIISTYGITNASINRLAENKEAYKVTDDSQKNYFLKIYNIRDGDDMIPNENVYHTHELIHNEMEMLHLLSGGALETAVPIKNIMGEWVTILPPGTQNDPPEYATMTSFIKAETVENASFPMTEMAFYAGVSAAQLHIESEKRLLPLAVKRPHKRQEYMQKMKCRLAVSTGAINASQLNMLNQCADIIIGCMNRLDVNMPYNVGLVHTDIRAANCVYMPKKAIPIDFSRSVYSYYLYDLGEMCAHMGGVDPNHDVRNAILQGYQSVKPFHEGHLFAVQAFMAMFLMMVAAETVDNLQNSWRDELFITFENEIHPGLISDRGFFKI